MKVIRPNHFRVLALLACLAGTMTECPGAVYKVTNTKDSGAGSLRKAITNALTTPGSDTVRFAANLSGKTIVLGSQVSILSPRPADSLVIDGSTLKKKIQISGNNSARIMAVGKNTRLILKSVVLAYGHAPDNPGAYDVRDGGAIYNQGILTIQQCFLAENSAGHGTASGGVGGRGGAIFNATFARLTLTDCSFARNQSGNGGPGDDGGAGGVLFNSAENTLIERCCFFENSTGDGGSSASYGGNGGDGGAVFNDGAATMIISSSTFCYNFTGAGGSNNSITWPGGFSGAGGAIYHSDIAFLLIYNSTIVANHTGPGGKSAKFSDPYADPGGAGGVFSDVDPFAPNFIPQFENSIVANNWVDTSLKIGSYLMSDTQGPIRPVASNLIRVYTDAGAFTSSEVYPYQFDPQLKDLAMNGGPTPTMALKSTSPAIDLGVSTKTTGATDQRGFLRVVNGNGKADKDGHELDLGAFEFRSALPRPEISIEQPKGKGLVDGKSTCNFGKAKVGGKAKAKTFVIRNKGTAKLKNLKIRVKGRHAADFRVSKPKKTQLAAGTLTTFKVKFQPKRKGVRKAEIRVQSNDGNENPFHIKLKGKGR